MEARLQLLDGSAGENQRVVLQDVIDVGANRRQDVDAVKVARCEREAVLDCFAVDHQRGLAEAELLELTLERLRLGDALKIVEHDQRTGLGMARKRHLEAERADLLVQRHIEHAGAGAVRLTAADEHGRAAIAVTRRAAALLATELLAGASYVCTLASGTRRGAAVLEVRGDAAMQDVGAGLEAENFVLELDVAASLGVEGFDLDLHLALLAFSGF